MSVDQNIDGVAGANDHGSAADRVLCLLERVKPTSQHAWLACCPSHADKAPSLAIKETDDGRVLIHCFAGCSAAEVVEALGLSLADLFPEGPKNHRLAPHTRPFPAIDALRVMAREALYLAAFAAEQGNIERLPQLDRGRVIQAAERIQSAYSAVTGGRS